MLEAGIFELVGTDEQVDQDDYSGSVEVSLPTDGPVSGEILSVILISTEDGSGAVQTPNGKLIFLDADPAVTSGDTALAAAEWPTVLGVVDIATTDWTSDANGGAAYITDTPIPFHALSSIFVTYKHEHATALNSAAGDDEQIECNFWYRRDA
jgi:hypothetical protein